MDLLESVGITKEEIIERIVDRALGITADYKQTGEESWEEIPLSKVVDKKITDAIGNLVDTLKVKIQERIESIIDQKVEAVFNAPFQPVNKWNEPVGGLTSIRELIAKEAIDYWKTPVDSSGTASPNSYNNKQLRSEYYARKVMTEIYDKELVAEVKKLAVELRQKIPATVGEEISKTVVDYLRR